MKKTRKRKAIRQGILQKACTPSLKWKSAKEYTSAFIPKLNKSIWQHSPRYRESYIAERPPGFGIVSRAACPVTCQRSRRPEQRKQKKQLAPRDTRAPSPERTQAWDNCGRRHSRRPHNRPGNRAGFLHGGLLRLHSKKRKMFEQPPESSGPAFGIASPADGIESEANAKNSSDSPVGDGMAAEVQENPAHDHGSDGGRDRMCRPRR